MMAPIAELRRAASRARSSLRDSIDSAAALSEAMGSRHPSDDDSDSEAEETQPEDLSPDDARELVEDVYEPLMRGEGERSKSTTRERDIEDDAGGFEGLEGMPPREKKVRKLEVYISYTIFFILGACILLPWNSEIVASGYMFARLEGSSLQASFSSWVALTFTTSNLVFLALANSSQQGANLARRISYSILLMSGVLVLFIVSTRFESINPTLFFSLLIASTITLAACASFLQNAVVALSSRFGAMYLQGILSGQGAVGLAVAILQFISALAATKLNPLTMAIEAVPPSSVRNSAFSFFLTIGVFSGFSLLCHGVLIKLPLYRLVIRSGDEDDSSSQAGHGRKVSLRKVEKKVRHLGISVFWIFLVTLSVFPSVTSSIQSVHDPATGGKAGGLGPRLSSSTLFVPLGFIVFNAGDWIGRAMPQVAWLNFTDWRLLMGASAARTVFIPLFLLCNVQNGSPDPPFINSDTLFLILMLLFALSNGYISTLIMLAAVVEPSLEELEIDIAATCLAFYLTSGLAVGSLISFPVRALICKCNPFV